MNLSRRQIITLLALALFCALLVYLWRAGVLDGDVSRAAIEDWVARAGRWGPMVVIGTMALAVVVSPVPSGPIAMAAGAAYGHTYGTIYVVIGAEVGALIAFTLARNLGRNAVLKWLGSKAEMGLLGSQNALTATVFLSRMMPFISFDIISYAAGLSCLHVWRFALATLAGIFPAAYLLAHFGGEVASGEMKLATWVVLGLGLITGLPLLIAAFRRSKPKD